MFCYKKKKKKMKGLPHVSYKKKKKKGKDPSPIFKKMENVKSHK